MHVIPFDSKHVATVKKWLLARGMSEHLTDHLPALGWVGTNKGVPVAAGFFRKIEGGSVILDSLITNPEELPDVRNKVLDTLVSHMLQEAKNLGFNGIIAYSSDTRTIERAVKHGFTNLPYQVISFTP